VTLVAALLLGVAVAFVVEAYDPRIVDNDQVDDRLPLLASIPRLRRRQAREYLAGGGRLPAGSWEAYRRLRNSVVDGSDAIRTVLVTSATAGEGKTMTAVNLSLVLAASGRRVVLIDGNLRRPGVAAALGLPAEIAGLGPLLEGHVAVEDVLVAAPGGGDRLRAIAAAPGDSVDLVDGRSVSSILQRLKPYADVIVVDSPALTEYADSVAWASVVDAVVVAVRVGVSRSDKLDELHRVLRQHSIRLAGTVVTGRRRARGPLEIAPYGAGAMAAASEAPATALAEVARR